jgi:hypothetical protein
MLARPALELKVVLIPLRKPKTSSKRGHVYEMESETW